MTVTITGNKVTETYDGSEKTAKGYTVSIDNDLYTEDDFTFTGEAEVKATNAGTYDMGLNKSQFKNKNNNFSDSNVEFVVNDGKLEMLLIRKPETLPDLHRLILALKNNDFSDKHIDFASASTFRLHAAAGFDWSIDGEYAAGGIDTVIRCVKDAVCIAAPRVENG